MYVTFLNLVQFMKIVIRIWDAHISLGSKRKRWVDRQSTVNRLFLPTLFAHHLQLIFVVMDQLVLWSIINQHLFVSHGTHCHQEQMFQSFQIIQHTHKSITIRHFKLYTANSVNPDYTTHHLVACQVKK